MYGAGRSTVLLQRRCNGGGVCHFISETSFGKGYLNEEKVGGSDESIVVQLDSLQRRGQANESGAKATHEMT